MRFLKLLFPVLLFSLSSSAQGYLPGFIIPNNGDTLKGYIKYVRTENSPRVIRFKADANAKVNKYLVANVRYFSIDIGYPLDFQRYSGPISMDDIKIDNITTLRDTSFRIDTVFLKILRRGKNITLYSYGDALKTRFFVADGQSMPTELIFRIYFKDNELHLSHSSNTVNEATYKKQLTALAEKYGKIDDNLRIEIAGASYDDETIEHIADKINGYTGPDPTKGNELARPPKTKLMIMVAAFAVVAYLTFSVMHH